LSQDLKLASDVFFPLDEAFVKDWTSPRPLTREDILAFINTRNPPESP
jgi:hypothetical protein